MTKTPSAIYRGQELVERFAKMSDIPHFISLGAGVQSSAMALMRISDLEAQVDNLQTDVEGLCHMLKKEKQHR